MYTSFNKQDSSWVTLSAAITILLSLIYSTASTSTRNTDTFQLILITNIKCFLSKLLLIKAFRFSQAYFVGFHLFFRTVLQFRILKSSVFGKTGRGWHCQGTLSLRDHNTHWTVRDVTKGSCFMWPIINKSIHLNECMLRCLLALGFRLMPMMKK